MARAVKRASAPPEVETLASVTHTYNYDYQSSNAAPTAGQAHQKVSSPGIILLNKTDHDAVDQSAFLTTLNNSSTLTINGVTYNVLSASSAGGVYTLSVSPPVFTGPAGVVGIKFFQPDQVTVTGGPLKFTPIIPTSPFPPGGGIGSIGQAAATPAYPPPTPPPIGAVPVGPLVGPAIAAAAAPPSTPGFALIRYQSPGSATVPPANGYSNKFTTTTAYAGFPNNPPTGVPIVFSNIDNRATKTGAVWDNKTPPSTPTTAQITLNGMSILVPHEVGVLDVGAVRDGHPEPAERSARAVFPDGDTAHLHQPQSPEDRGS